MVTLRDVTSSRHEPILVYREEIYKNDVVRLGPIERWFLKNITVGTPEEQLAGSKYLNSHSQAEDPDWSRYQCPCWISVLSNF